MIRVNLLPNKKQSRRTDLSFLSRFTSMTSGGGGSSSSSDSEGSQAWLGVLLGVVVLEVLILLVVYKTKGDQLTKAKDRNLAHTATITSIQANISQHEQLKAQLTELRERENAIAKLQAARTGPTATLLELSKILSPGRGPTVDRDKLEQLRRDNPLAVPNPNWDTHRLWLTTYAEKDRVVKVGGLARDGEDVSELLRRLALSDFFYDVKLLPASKEIDPTTKLELVKFEFSAMVRY
ncbi:MAG TPA: PilN domain-containing protein [Polyangiaceae bacterium]|jgi:type IV pilus assembly protein PilN|nr:PilN domain-containing protein [Polyangiaceae bacterium]